MTEAIMGGPVQERNFKGMSLKPEAGADQYHSYPLSLRKVLAQLPKGGQKWPLPK